MTAETLSAQQAANLIASIALVPTDFNTCDAVHQNGTKIWKSTGQVRGYEGFLADVHVYPTRGGLFAVAASVRPDHYSFNTSLLPSLMTVENITAYGEHIYEGMKYAAQSIIDIREVIDNLVVQES